MGWMGLAAEPAMSRACLGCYAATASLAALMRHVNAVCDEGSCRRSFSRQLLPSRPPFTSTSHSALALSRRWRWAQSSPCGATLTLMAICRQVDSCCHCTYAGCWHAS